MGNADRRLSRLERELADDEVDGLPEKPPFAGRSREFAILELLDWCRLFTKNANVDEKEPPTKPVEWSS